MPHTCEFLKNSEVKPCDYCLRSKSFSAYEMNLKIVSLTQLVFIKKTNKKSKLKNQTFTSHDHGRGKVNTKGGK